MPITITQDKGFGVYEKLAEENIAIIFKAEPICIPEDKCDLAQNIYDGYTIQEAITYKVKTEIAQYYNEKITTLFPELPYYTQRQSELAPYKQSWWTALFPNSYTLTPEEEQELSDINDVFVSVCALRAKVAWHKEHMLLNCITFADVAAYNYKEE